MLETFDIEKQAAISYERLLPRLLPIVGSDDLFAERLYQQFLAIFGLFYGLYGDRYDFFYHLEQVLISTAEAYAARPDALRALDLEREADPNWFQSETMIGGVCYVDLFAGTLDGLRAKIPYLNELGLTYLHLMPLFLASENNSDGGYAVSDYRTVNPALGTMDELADLAREFRANGISLVVDFVFNHTSDEHQWAQRALAGDEAFSEFYYFFDDRTLPDQYERTLREIFPQQAPGNFTFRADVSKWVWTTFNTFQWDLNYSNPAVFNAMLQELLFLANHGVEVIRLDAVAFLWKRLGTSCENLPQTHVIIQAFNALVRVAAPALLFKSEAIVHPREVALYIRADECPVSYNPTLMALLWESLATRETKLLLRSMQNRFEIADDCAWVNYVRVHDDIGWTFADEDAAEVGINGYDHRQFLNRYYTGAFYGSFADGVPFNYNPANHDMRICGTAASLAGLEQALKNESDDRTRLVDLALRRLLLIHSVILSIGGIPLLYLGDELATPNDYSYEQDAHKRYDNRWVHRPFFDWQRAERRTDRSTPEGRMFQGLRWLINLRKQTPTLADGLTAFVDVGNPHLFAYTRHDRLLMLANFSEDRQMVSRANLPLALPDPVTELVTGRTLALAADITLAPYQFLWLDTGTY